MKSAAHKLSRGRPPSRTDGAAKAFDKIEQYRTAKGLNNHALALLFNMTPSTVNRVLASRDAAAWTPGLTELYRNVENATSGDTDKPVVQRLADYKGPGDVIVRRILEDVDALIVTLAKRKK